MSARGGSASGGKKIIVVCIIIFAVFGIALASQASTAHISSISPTSVLPGETVVTVLGSGFGDVEGESVVFFGLYDWSMDVTYWSDTKIIALAPEGLYYYPGRDYTVAVSVCVNAFTCTPSNRADFRVKPQITDFYPKTAKAGDRVDLTGKDFGYDTGFVTINGRSAELTYWGNESVSFLVPDTYSGDINLTSNHGREATVVSLDIQGFGAEPASEPASVSFLANEKSLVKSIDWNLARRLQGNILLQVEENGEGWYVYPDDLSKYYLGRPADAFAVMRELGLGATHDFITSYTIYPSHVVGKILLDVEDSGKAYYIYPKDKKAYYLGRPADAFAVMRELGLGITNKDIRKIQVWEVN